MRAATSARRIATGTSRAGRASSWRRSPKPIAIPESTIDATASRPAIVSLADDRSACVSSTELTGAPHRGPARDEARPCRGRVRSGPERASRGPGRRPGGRGRRIRDGHGDRRLLVARLGPDRPPDDHAEVDERDLEQDEHEDGLPDHGHVESTRSVAAKAEDGAGVRARVSKHAGCDTSHRPYAVGLRCPLHVPRPRRFFVRFVTRLLATRLSCRLRARSCRSGRRPHVGRLPRRPGAALRRHAYQRDGPRAPERVDRAQDAGRVAPDRTRPAGKRDRPVRPGLQVRRPRRVRPERPAARHGGAHDALGDAAVGERRSEAAGVAPQHA